ncbi:MAG: beta-N-acetylhexosaminidase [Bacillota bacterium]|nr:beta-N-acetylhexosaminidase [Bacillota bacterium]
MKRFLVALFIAAVALLVYTADISMDSGRVPEQRAGEDELSLIDKVIGGMTLEDKIGEMLIVGIDGEIIDDETIRMLRTNKPGGIIIYKRNVSSGEQVGRLIKELQEYSLEYKDIGLFIGIDHEGGRVNRLPAEYNYPSARELGSTNDPEGVKGTALEVGGKLKGLGFNMNFGPVLDIDSNPQNPVIGDRSFGKTPETVSRMGCAFIEGMEAAGVIPVAKHFPGHGDTLVDSHTGLPVLSHTEARVMEFETVPFREAIDKGVPAIMTAHILFPSIDADRPATMSPTIINGLLRGTLGFEGVVITDDLLMGAISSRYKTGDAAVLAVEAGVDMLLIALQSEGAQEVVDALKAAVETGRISPGRIDTSVRRILMLKQDYGIAVK